MNENSKTKSKHLEAQIQAHRTIARGARMKSAGMSNDQVAPLTEDIAFLSVLRYIDYRTSPCWEMLSNVLRTNEVPTSFRIKSVP